MPLEQNDRELISLLVSQQIRDDLVDQRSRLVDEVVGQLASDARFALIESQIRERAEQAVETSLRRRYSAIAIVTAALVGGGAAAITQAYLTAVNLDAASLLQKNKAALGAYEDFMARSRQQLLSTAEALNPIREDVERDKLLFEGHNAITDAQQAASQNALALLKRATTTLGQLKAEADQLLAKSGEKSAVSADAIDALQKDISNTEKVLEANRFRVFLHFGTNSLGPALEAQIKTQFSNSGFIVVGTDSTNDDIGGLRIDYFFDDDCAGAMKLANILSSALPPGSPAVTLKKETVVNRPGTLGVWESRKPAASVGAATKCSIS